jgi:hypothetical protein
MNWLTKQEKWVLFAVMSLLVVGMCVKQYRTAHPATTASQPAKP